MRATAVSTVRSICGSPVLVGEPSTAEAHKRAAALKVLTDPLRLRLVSLIRAAPQGRAVTRDLVERLEVGQPTVSRHLGVLSYAGFVRREHRGCEAWYAIELATVATISQLLEPGRP